MNYRFSIPTTVECGTGISGRAGEFLRARGASRVFVVTDAGIRNAGLLEPVLHSLEEHGLKYDIFDETEPNPSAESVMTGLERLKQKPHDHILALGGGSSIDTAKGIGIMATNKGHILDYEGVNRIPHPGLPVVAIPTTAGTGSEVTASTIITNSQTHFKAAVISPYIFPQLALLDPQLTEKLPQELTAATGMDALTHAIESYTSKTATPFSRALAIEAIRMIGQNLKKAYFVGNDPASREQMLVASAMAGMAFAQSRLGNVHAISHTLGGVFNIPHGIANAALLPYVMKYNLPACPEKMKDIAEALGCRVDGLPLDEAAELAVQAVVELNRALNIPSNIRELGVDLKALPKLVEDSMRSGNVLVNPRWTRSSDIERIIRNAYEGNLSV
jgi:alcohol dehydrogenase class IV